MRRRNPPRPVAGTCGENVPVVARVHHECHGELPGVGEAARGLRLLARLGEHREENRRQDRNNRDHHQQLDEGETASLVRHWTATPYGFDLDTFLKRGMGIVGMTICTLCSLLNQSKERVLLLTIRLT